MRRAALALLAVGACGLPGSHYEPSADGGIDSGAAIAVHATESLQIVEGFPVTLQLTVSSPPPAPLNVALASTLGNVQLASTYVYFTADDYQIERTITVTAVSDDDDLDTEDVITIGGVGVVPGTVPVTITDDEVQGIQINRASLTIDEGGTAQLMVRMAAMPAQPVVVTSESTDYARTSASPQQLLFTPADWNVWQTITIDAPPDADLVDDAATITLASNGLTSVPVAITLRDTGA